MMQPHCVDVRQQGRPRQNGQLFAWQTQLPLWHTSELPQLPHESGLPHVSVAGPQASPCVEQLLGAQQELW
jgi:hypothetical protein